MPEIIIMNPHDSQGNQITDSDGIYPTVRGCGGGGYQQGYLFDRGNRSKRGANNRMKHYGDIKNLSGYDLPVVDVITGGSPCQDLSVAGNREGLAGERSGLFMEQIRIVKEMREKDREDGRANEFIRPRYMVWENVCGAFSSNKGRDFQAVLTEIVKIIEPDAPDVPMPEKGKWSKSGCIYDELGGWSIAWRVHDAQFWGATQYVDGRMLSRGTPQRRKRIALVADFAGLSAPEVLLERKSLLRHSEPSGETGEAAPRNSKDSIGESDPEG